jgi:hypothetical protein
VIRLKVDRLPNGADPKPVWLWWSGTGASEADVDRLWHAFLRRRKLEHELAELRPLADQVEELERDLAATRTSLRQMIRERALEPGPNGPEGHA